MTKEDVLKKFKFDIITGRLISQIPYGNLICPFDLDSEDEILYFSKILNSLEFIKAKNTQIAELADGVSINLNDKVYWFYSDTPFDKKTGNKVPQYFYKYMEELMNEEERRNS